MADQHQIVFELDASSLYAAILAVSEAWGALVVTDAAAAIVLDHTRQRFLQELSPDGAPWIPSQAAIDRRAAGGTGTLFATGTLWRSIQELAATGDDTEAERIISAGAVNARGTEYGQFAQYGTKYMPARPFMGINLDDVDLFEQRMLQRVADILEI